MCRLERVGSITGILEFLLEDSGSEHGLVLCSVEARDYGSRTSGFACLLLAKGEVCREWTRVLVV
jgi:hypothetical protein